MNIQEREILREKLREERLARKEEMKQRLDEEKQRRKAEKAKVTSDVTDNGFGCEGCVNMRLCCIWNWLKDVFCKSL